MPSSHRSSSHRSSSHSRCYPHMSSPITGSHREGHPTPCAVRQRGTASGPTRRAAVPRRGTDERLLRYTVPFHSCAHRVRNLRWPSSQRSDFGCLGRSAIRHLEEGPEEGARCFARIPGHARSGAVLPKTPRRGGPDQNRQLGAPWRAPRPTRSTVEASPGRSTHSTKCAQWRNPIPRGTPAPL
jgi:hypothetical protein